MCCPDLDVSGSFSFSKTSAHLDALAGDDVEASRMKRFAPFLVLAVAACGSPTKDEDKPQTIRTTYRAISGASMGAIGSSALFFEKPDEWDAAALLGGPLDVPMLLRSMDRFHLGAFCTLSELEALNAQGKLNDPVAVDACSTPKRPQTIQFEHSQDFNHWVPTTNGGSFNRDMYIEIFEDLTLTSGNVLYDNPASPFAPPGVDPMRLFNKPTDFCTTPTVVQGLRNLEYNPNGTYNAITFCDGQLPIYFCRDTQEIVNFCSDPANIQNPLNPTQAETFAQAQCASKGGAQVASKQEQPLIILNNWGKVDACRLGKVPMTVALAVDINGNGRRDYGEPIINNGQERYDDFGKDGCPDAKEDGNGGCSATANASGDPNGDNYDAEKNAIGTENNWIYDEGEPFRDTGLDGVGGTGDKGEGNGTFDMSEGRKTAFSRDGRHVFSRLDEKAKARLSFYFDGGVRDVFNLGLMSKQLYGLVAHFAPYQSGSYRAFKDIPGMINRSGIFDPWTGAWRTTPRHMLVLYGKDNPTDQDRISGEGDHVGDGTQAVDRFATMFGWLGNQWPSLPKPPTKGGSGYDKRVLINQWYQSEALKAKRDYAIYLPPGYDAPGNENVRYPVAYVLHGYGMEPTGMAATSLFADPNMKEGGGNLRPMIMVFPSGRCCRRELATGARDCREQNDQGVVIDSLQGWIRECNSGTFYMNSKGYTNGGGFAYGDAFYELVKEVDAKYRTLPAAEVEAR